MSSVSLSKYIGREYEKYNCFDLVKEFYLDHFNLDLRNYYEGSQVPERKAVQSLIVSNKGDFVPVSNPEFGDIVVIKLYGLESHIGVCVGEGKFIHSVRVIGSALENLKKYERMIAGYYRHRERHD